MYLTLVISDDCDACERAKIKLNKIKIDYPKIVTNIININKSSNKGILITPALLIDEELFSYGDIDENKLIPKIS